MARSNFLKLARVSTRCIRSPLIPKRSLRALCITQTSKPNPLTTTRAFHASKPSFKGLSPETDNPQPKQPEAHTTSAAEPTEITLEEYHQVADACMDTIVAKLEQLQETREDVDVEFSVRIYLSPIHTLSLSFIPTKYTFMSLELSRAATYADN
jgi:frataxin